MEDQMGTWEATRVFGEELEMHKIELNHNVLGCRECLVEGVPAYCSHSRHHPDHPLHVCLWVGGLSMFGAELAVCPYLSLVC